MKCPICNAKQIPPYKYFYKYRTCNNCKGHFIDTKIKVTYPKTYFNENEKIKILAQGQLVINFFLKLRINYIKNILKKHKACILDYGCGAGKLVEALNKSGLKTLGFEPSEGARIITRKSKLPVYNFVKKVRGGYDLIMFWQSLEHTTNPLQIISKSKNLLSPNGKILIAVPNADSPEALMAGEKWFHLTYPMHRIQFTPKSIKIMLEKCGFKIEKIDYFNPEYTLSGLSQTVLNFFLPKDILYSVVASRRFTMPYTKSLIYAFVSIICLITFSPIIISIYFIELLFKKTDAILLTACKSTVNAAYANQKI